MVLPPADLAVRPVCESPNKEIANADPHDRETHGMSAHVQVFGRRQRRAIHAL
jgi:hypothetical protein